MPRSAISESLTGKALKIGVIASCITGIATHSTSGDGGFMSSIFQAFTIQSNIWIALICAVELLSEDHNFTEGPGPTLSTVKHMATTSILLTWIVFAVMLAPAMNPSYLASVSNILLHTVTPVLAAMDYLHRGVAPREGRVGVLSPIILPLSYSIYFFISYGITGKMPVPYFFLDYVRFGWFRIGSSGIGVAYWIIILTILLIVMGRGLIRLRRSASVKPTIILAAAATMIGLSLATSLATRIK